MIPILLHELMGHPGCVSICREQLLRCRREIRPIMNWMRSTLLSRLKLSWVSLIVCLCIALFLMIMLLRLLLMLCCMCRWTTLRRLGFLFCLYLENCNSIVFAFFELSSLSIDNQVVSTSTIWTRLASWSDILLNRFFHYLFLSRCLFRSRIDIKYRAMRSLNSKQDHLWSVTCALCLNLTLWMWRWLYSVSKVEVFEIFMCHIRILRIAFVFSKVLFLLL